MKDFSLYIEAYLDGQLSAEALDSFEKELSSNPALAAEVEELKALRTDLAWLSAKRDVKAAAVLRGQIQAKRLRQWRFLIVTLGFILAGFLAFWIYSGKSSPSEQTPPVFQEPKSGNLEVAQPEIEDKAPIQGTPSESKLPAVPSAPQHSAPTSQKSNPIAADLRPNTSRDRMRSLPPEPVSANSFAFYTQQFKNFKPLVQTSGAWAKPIQLLRSQQAIVAHELLSKMPQNDTTIYLIAVSELALQRPAAAEDQLYTLLSKSNWKIEAQYLLLWTYMLEGKLDLARTSAKVLPSNYRDVPDIKQFLEN